MAMIGITVVSLQAQSQEWLWTMLGRCEGGGGGGRGLRGLRGLRPGLRFCCILQKQPPTGCKQDIFNKKNEPISKIVSFEMLLHECRSVNMQLSMLVTESNI